MSAIGSEWVLILLILISVASVALILERWFFYRDASKANDAFRTAVRDQVSKRNWDLALQTASSRVNSASRTGASFDAAVAAALLSEREKDRTAREKLAADALTTTRVKWEKNLALLATIGSNAPFVGLFGTVLGIIQAFHHLSMSEGGGAGVSGVTAGLAEALIATAVGILVAIPATVAFNLFTRRVRRALMEAEAFQNFILSQLQGH